MGLSEPFLIAVMDIDIDLPRIIDDAKQIVEEFKSSSKDSDLSRPYSIVLTEIADDTVKSDLVSYKDVHNQAFFDRPHHANLKDRYKETSLQDLASKLPFTFSMMRLSVLPPTTIIGMHTDESSHVQIAIDTNEDCFVAARSGECKHIPCDGKMYVISTTLPHTAFNASQVERIHLSISMLDEDYVKLLNR